VKRIWKRLEAADGSEGSTQARRIRSPRRLRDGWQ
jgi:hypothetical protein